MLLAWQFSCRVQLPIHYFTKTYTQYTDYNNTHQQNNFLLKHLLDNFGYYDTILYKLAKYIVLQNNL